MKQLIACLWLVAASFAYADPKWDRSPESYFMTQEERTEWESLKSADEQERFIAAFRARHASDFAAEVERRARIVDERMSLGDERASLTMRGRIVILLGAPTDLKARYIPRPGPGKTGHPLDTRKGGASDNAQFKPTLMGGFGGWVEYTLTYAPHAAPGVGADGLTVVIEADSNTGKDRIKYPRRQRRQLEETLDAAARIALRAR